MIQSFRLRLALLSALLSGVALLAFGVGSWWLIRGIKLERMGSELRFHAEREVSRQRSAAEWERMETALVGTLGVRDSRNLLLWVQQDDEAPVYRSPHWPPALNAAQLPWPPLTSVPARSGWAVPLIAEANAGDISHSSPVLLALAGAGGGPGGGGPSGGPGGGGPGGGPGGPGAGLAGSPGARQGAPLERMPPQTGPISNDRPPAQDRPPPGLQDTNITHPPPRLFGAQQRQQAAQPSSIEPQAQVDSTRPDAPVPRDGDLPPALERIVPPTRQTPLPEAIPLLTPSTRSEVGAAPAPSFAPPTARMEPPAPPLPPPPPAPPVSLATSQFSDGQVWRIGLARFGHARLAVAVDVRVIDGEMNSIRNAFLIALPFALTLIGLGGWLFSSRALRPIHRLTEATRRVTAAGLDQRITGKGEDREFIELIDVFNRMLGRLERSFKQATRFSADAAHELKTPLAIVQGQLERAISMADDGSPMQAELTSILDETRRLSTISRKLLLLSRADAGRLNVLGETFNLSDALEELLEDTRMLAPLLEIRSEIQPGLSITADASLLRQVLYNLISNAIKYNIEHGWIRVATARWAQRVEIMVSNTSHGIPTADRDKVFERFYRVDAAHSRQIEGVGLGLSVAREIARAHGGELTLKPDVDGVVQFSLLLPLAGASTQNTHRLRQSAPRSAPQKTPVPTSPST